MRRRGRILEEGKLKAEKGSFKKSEGDGLQQIKMKLRK